LTSIEQESVDGDQIAGYLDALTEMLDSWVEDISLRAEMHRQRAAHQNQKPTTKETLS
jgi:hypothetical protein